ncbi:MAG: hypothetical protein COA78_12145 [Blastopirellula sp.]|nr:MAG: hypothetical protein COA78_12145 [Blastopirellula sp.]
MAKNNQRQRKLTITDELRLGVNAKVTRKLAGQSGEEILSPLSSLNEVVIASKTILASENGKHFILNDATPAILMTLPLPAVGLEFWFHIGANAPTATHQILPNGSANIIVGNITSPEVVALVAVVQDADAINFILNLAVHGDYAHVYSDGTNWFLDGMCAVQDGMTTTQV